jgi:hypothetical protein
MQREKENIGKTVCYIQPVCTVDRWFKDFNAKMLTLVENRLNQGFCGCFEK